MKSYQSAEAVVVISVHLLVILTFQVEQELKLIQNNLEYDEVN